MNRIKELRLKNKLSQAELGEKLNLPQETLSKYENGIYEPKIETWQALADYFNVSVPYLQGKIFKEDLDDEAQEMFEDVQDYISYVVPNELIEIVLKALLNSYEYNYESDRWK